MTLSTIDTVKDAASQSEAKTRAQFIANRKEVLIKKWWDQFNDPNENGSFEELYNEWAKDAYFGILSQEYTIPSIELCEDQLNDRACTWKRFNSFFQTHLKLKR